jgi:hypothetical protein
LDAGIDTVLMTGAFTNSSILAGTDNDIISFFGSGLGTNLIDLGSNSDSIIFSTFSFGGGSLSGGADNDTMVFTGTTIAGAAQLSIYAGDGNDSIFFNSAAKIASTATTAYIWDGLGDDTIVFAQGLTTFLNGGTAGAYVLISTGSGNNVISFGGYDGISSTNSAIFNLGGVGTTFTLGAGGTGAATVVFATGGTLNLVGFGTDALRNSFTAIGFGNQTLFSTATGTGTFSTLTVPVFS